MEQKIIKLLEKRGQMVSTVPEIAEALKRTKLISSKCIDFPFCELFKVSHSLLVGGKGKAASMIALRTRNE